ncbi:hypothetical protein SD70_14990 [Gordoniibacillus kamchatkensis]|uniref:Restriction system protein n=1 Tax=Gordoniibacillus kamchatkensis TaxID=1590651 RepID=A0ABR5AHG5_9BACL|nr:hypothetical protein SD70_14990 [Paenibacillus sp. VKM B-2647]
MGFGKLVICCVIIIALLAALITAGTQRTSRRTRSKPKVKHSSGSNRTVSRKEHQQRRSDETILTTSLDDLSGAEFERLLALYFTDQGFEVKEVGIGGKDGGVDLVITDRRGEKTAVQAKCYAPKNLVGVQIVRELVGAKRNHDCILSLLVTTSDLTEPAKQEAEKFKVDYWHGALVEQKLRSWGKWQPVTGKNKRKATTDNVKSARFQVAATTEVQCSCGSAMVLRKSKEGKSFWGCSRFPTCRNTRSV